MANTYAATLATFITPHLDYIMDEASGDYANNGDGGVLPVVAINNPMRAAPGVIRNAPFEYGIWGQPQGSIFGASAGAGEANMPAVVGWSTGVFSCFIMRFSLLDGDDWVPFSLQYRSGVALSVGSGSSFVINENGRLFFVINRTIDSGGTDSMMVSSDAVSGVIDLATPYHLAVVQRGDSSGLHLFVNGVEIASTTTFGAGSNVNSFLDIYDAAGQTLSGPMVFNGVAAGNTTTFGASNPANGIMQRPTVWRNETLTDGEILSLGLAGALNATPQDYYEYMLDRFVLTDPSYYLQLGWLGGSANDRTMDAAQLNTTTHSRLDWNVPRQLTNQVDSSRVSTYPLFSSRFNDGGGQYTQSGSTSEIGNTFTGSVVLLVTINSNLGVLDADRRPIYSFGEGGGGSSRNVSLHLGGTSFGTSIIYTIGGVGPTGTTSGDFYRRIYLPGDTGLSTVTPHFVMISLVQDGNAVVLYVNNERINQFNVESFGPLLDEDSWWGSLVVGSERSVPQYPAATQHAQDLDVHQFMVLKDTALTQTQIIELFDAVNGIFPAEDAPPSGGFNDTLVNTGNEPPGNPNGPGPDHYWRMNAAAAPIFDIGINPLDGTSRATGGDPSFGVQGPLVSDPTNAAIFFDGQGDYFEIGLDGAVGQLVTTNIGTVGFFLSRNDLLTKNIAYSQANDVASAFIEWYVEGENIEFKIQTSAGNSATFTSSIQASTLDFFFIVMTNDATTYRFYINGVLDAAAALVLVGTGTEGLWFNDITATRSAVGARADSSFNVQAKARVSELFIYEEVLTAAQIGALWDAAILDGSLGLAATVGVISFDNVTFKNGGVADVHVQKDTSSFQQVVKVRDCKFLGGAQGLNNQSILLTGPAIAQVTQSEFDLGETPSTGRCAIVGTAIDPTAIPTAFGSIVANDNTFKRMGHLSTTLRPAVFLEAAFGATVAENRFEECFGSAVGWRGDARRVQVHKNIIGDITTNLAAIASLQGLNLGLGTDWLIEGNEIDVTTGSQIILTGANSTQTLFARNIQIKGNKGTVVGEIGYLLFELNDLSVKANQIGGSPTNGIQLGAMQGLVKVQRNGIKGNTLIGITQSEATLQIVTLICDRNTIESSNVGDGVLFTNVDRLSIVNNKLVNVVNGVQIGNIGTSFQFFGNQLTSVSVPFFLIGGTTQVGMEIGRNQLADLGTAKDLTVVSNAVDVFAPYHTVTSAGAVDLNNLGALSQDGYVVIVQLATGSADITAKDGTGNMLLAGDFLMDTPSEDQLWLVRSDTNWVELARFAGSP